jgi:hypothetical protein
VPGGGTGGGSSGTGGLPVPTVPGIPGIPRAPSLPTRGVPVIPSLPLPSVTVTLPGIDTKNTLPTTGGSAIDLGVCVPPLVTIGNC